MLSFLKSFSTELHIMEAELCIAIRERFAFPEQSWILLTENNLFEPT